MIWIALSFCLLVSFLFSGIEAGLLSINPVRLSHHVRLRDAGALRLQALLMHPQRLLLTVLLVTNFMNISALVLLTGVLTAHLGRWGFPAAFCVGMPTFVVLLEMLPKSLFRRFPYRLLAALSQILLAVYWMLSPAIYLLATVGKFFFRSQGSPDIFIAREELKDLALQVEQGGSLTTAEREMIHNVVDFRLIRARDVMRPLAEMNPVRPETPVAELLALSRGKGLDRFPVLGDDGKIIGLVRAFEILLDGRRNTSARHHLRRIVTATLDEPAYQIIRKLRAARLSLAAVVDENGMPAGVVCPEDLIDRLISVNITPTAPP